MRRLLILPLGLLTFFLWYLVSPGLLPSRYPIHYSDGSFHDVGMFTWTEWLLSPGQTGVSFRSFIESSHKWLFIEYACMLIFCVLVPMLAMSFKSTGYKELKKSGQDLIEDTFWGRLKLKLHSRLFSGVHFGYYQRIAKKQENTHLVVLGSTGSGKTQSILGLLKDIIKREDKCIVLDIKGDYTAFMCDPEKAILLSPGDARTPDWKVGMDIKRPDIDLIVQALIEEDKNMAPEWHLAARAALRAVLLNLIETKKNFSFMDIDNALIPDRVREAVRKFDPKLYDTLKDPNSETGRGVLFVLHSLSQGLGEISGKNGIFSLSEFLRSPTITRLIIKRHPSQEFTFRLTARLLLGALQGYVMSLPDDRNRRIWVILDELSTLRKFPPLVDFLERGRSKGLCVVGGIQDWGVLEKYYEEEARTMYTCFVNKVFLAMREPVSAEYYSKSFGECTFDRTTTTANRNNVFSVMPALSVQVQTQTRPVISASDLLQLPQPDKKICGYTQISGYPLAKVSFPITPMEENWPGFIPEGVGTGGLETKQEGKKKLNNQPPEGESSANTAKVSQSVKVKEASESLTIEPFKNFDINDDVDLQYTRTTITEKFSPKDTPGNNLKDVESFAKDLGKLLVGLMSGIPVPEIVEEVEEVLRVEKAVKADRTVGESKKNVVEPETLQKHFKI